MTGKSKVRILIAASLVLAAAAIAIAVVATRPVELRFAAAVDQEALAALHETVAEYEAARPRIRIAFSEEAGAEADLYVGPYAEGGIPWRSLGWKLWTRIETLARLEGELGFSAIRRLREGSLAQADLDRVLAAAMKKSVAPFVLPEAPASYGSAIEGYRAVVSASGAPAPLDLERKGTILRVKDLRAAADAVVKGKALFILGPDAIATWLGRSPENHPEGFNLPGSRAEGSSWVLGRTEAFFVSASAKRRVSRAAADLVTHLTSEGVAKAFGARLAGEFRSWAAAPKPGELPVIAGWSRYVDPELTATGSR
jgi:hypothetical protein